MSAMAVIFQPEAIHLFTDAAFYDPSTGVLTGAANKVWRVPGVDAVFSSRGVRAAFPFFLELCAARNVHSFDELKACLPSVFLELDEWLAGYTGEILIAGWSESALRAEVLFRANHCDYADLGLEAGKIYRWTEGRLAFGFDAALLPAPADFTIERVISAFETGRRELLDLSCGEASEPIMAHAIGGFIQHAIIGPNDMSSQTVHQWDDLIGSPIMPVMSEPVPVGAAA
ncbi:hypothetical protein [Aliihoeflea sp. 2WW]|uniref:hypothetical protein n=1 Tax=Aliihoeflea sp. 2WW TaxID=1381123 RepID=UPI0004668291|nr:hypothetical protein [Aliihoeflea sp. 2WW]